MKHSYTNSSYYNIRLTSRYLKLFTAQILKKYGDGISSDEILALDIIKQYGSMCQRDLAKLLFRDRANTGKIANSLMEKGYIKINAEQKNNRLVKTISLSEEGDAFLLEVFEKCKPILNSVNAAFTYEENEQLNDMLKKLRNALTTVTEIQI